MKTIPAKNTGRQRTAVAVTALSHKDAKKSRSIGKKYENSIDAKIAL